MSIEFWQAMGPEYTAATREAVRDFVRRELDAAAARAARDAMPWAFELGDLFESSPTPKEPT